MSTAMPENFTLNPLPSYGSLTYVRLTVDGREIDLRVEGSRITCAKWRRVGAGEWKDIPVSTDAVVPPDFQCIKDGDPK